MRVALNGMGRIGKNFLRVVCADKKALEKITLVAVNLGPASKEFVAHEFKYDSLLGTYPGKVALIGDMLHIDDTVLQVFTESNAENLPWKALTIDWVVDCSGRYTHREQAEQHIKSGAKAVLISAPAHGDDVTIIPGVNDAAFDSINHTIVSLGSCTTNALVPMLKVLHDAFEIEQAFMTTVHAYTNSQWLLDGNDHDPRRARAAVINCIPTTTGASATVGKIVPALADKVIGVSLRVPLDKVSLIDLVVQVKQKVTAELINKAFERAAQSSSLEGILTTTKEPLVSSDFKGNNSSVIIDELLTSVQGSMVKVFGWYDNEWGYSQRLKDFLMRVYS